MLKVLRVLNGRFLSRAAFVSVVGGLAAGCSLDSTRFGGDPFSDPFTTGAINKAPQPVPQREANTWNSAPTYPQAQPVVVAPSNQPVVTVGQGGWTATGGTRVVVGNGDSLTSISNRYGVPSNAILSTNGLSNASQVSSGREIIIPIYDASGTAQASARNAVSSVPSSSPTVSRVAEVSRPVQQAAPQPPTLRPLPPSRPAEPQRVASIDPKQVPATSAAPSPAVKPVAVAKPSPAPTAVSAPAKPIPAPVPAPAKPAATAAAKPAPSTQASAPARSEEVKTAAVEAAAPSIAAADGTDFRWPARGRVIAGFGSGGGNDGINIALPEGTPVKAAEGGTVTYAGDEVKGYGNLVLIKHDNGYISAYAHNGDLSVKRGEKVRRGQVIATSGRSGNVTSPQLHFELRKGSTPVDPVPRLGGG